MADINTVGKEFTPNEGGIGMPDQKECPYEPLSTGKKMRRGKQPQIFDNNGNEDKLVIPNPNPYYGWGQQ